MGLDVAMDQLQRVGGVERGGDLPEQLERPLRRQLLALQDRAEVVALDVLQHEVEPAVDLAEVVDADDVRVVEVGLDLGLATEPRAEGRVLAQVAREDLDRDAAVEPLLDREVDTAHPAAADLLDDLIALDLDLRRGHRDPAG